MMKSERHDDEAPFSAKRYFAHLTIWSAGLAFVLIAGLLVIFGIRDYSVSGETADFWLVLLGAPITLAASVYLWKTAPDFTLGEPHTPRGNRMRWLLVAIVLIGIAMSLPINLADSDQGGRLLFGNGPVPSRTALIVLLMWGAALPAVTILGRRTSDEHARTANDFGMAAGYQAFYYVAPIWWMGWRGGFFSQPDVMILFVGAAIVCAAATMWKRFA